MVSLVSKVQVKQALVEQDMYRQRKNGHLEGPDYAIKKKKTQRISPKSSWEDASHKLGTITFLCSHAYSAYNLTFGCLQKQELTFACPGGQKAKPSFEDTKQETIRKAIPILGRKRINSQFGDFPVATVAETSRSQRREPGFHSWSGS